MKSSPLGKRAGSETAVWALLICLAVVWGSRLRGQSSLATAAPGEYLFTTLAGFKTPNGTAGLKYPFGLARDSTGNLYFSDSGNHVIRKLSPGGVLTILAGQPGTLGFDDGSASTAGFWNPNGLALAPDGTLYIADSGSRRLRALSPAGNVSTVAGQSADLSPLDGYGTDARFGTLDHLTIDEAGNLYASDLVAHVIRKIEPTTRRVTTIAGRAGISGTVDGIGAAARFGRPQGVAADGKGHLFIVDHDGQCLRKMDLATGAVTTIAGSPGLRGRVDGTGSAARFNYPTGVTTDSAGNVYVSDWNNYTVRKVTPAGVVTTVAGVAAIRGNLDGPLGVARLDGAQDLLVAPDGTLFIADWLNNLIRKVSPGGVMTTVAGIASGGFIDGPGSEARFNNPVAPAIDAQGNVYLVDRGNKAIRKISRTGLVTTVASNVQAVGLAFDRSGTLFVASDYQTVDKIAPGGQRSTLAGSLGQKGSTDGEGSAARFEQLGGLAFATDGNLYVTDSVGRTIRKVSPTGIVTTLAGATGQSGFADGAGAAARFQSPSGIASDSTGVLFVADLGNGLIRRITPAGVVTTLAGNPGEQRVLDGTGNQAAFHSPCAIAVTSGGELLVAENSGVVRRITAAGVVTTLGGRAFVFGATDGPGTAARFSEPRGIAVDASGSLYLTDTLNHMVRLAQNTAPTLITPTRNEAVAPGGSVTLTAEATGNGPLKYQWSKDGVTLPDANTETLRLEHATAASEGEYAVTVSNTVGSTRAAIAILRVQAAPAIAVAPRSTAVILGGQTTLRVEANGTPAPTYQWRKNGLAITGAYSATLSIDRFGLADAGAYDVVVTNRAGSRISTGAVLGVGLSAKVASDAYEYVANIHHPKGGIYDQILLTGSIAAFTADAGETTRASFIDLTGDIVQVELSGAGTVTVLLASASGPAVPEKYQQDVPYLRGHATLVVSAADRSTNLSVFSVGKVTAPNPALYRDVDYDGIADVARIMIGTTDGQFGGLRAANTHCFEAAGVTGVWAPGVRFLGPLYLGNLDAHDAATPVLLIAECKDVRITGGDLRQSNGAPVQVSGIARLALVDGTNSHGLLLPAQTNRARIVQDGIDVTAEIVSGP